MASSLAKLEARGRQNNEHMEVWSRGKNLDAVRGELRSKVGGHSRCRLRPEGPVELPHALEVGAVGSLTGERSIGGSLVASGR